MSQTTDTSNYKNLCQYWEDLEICAKYEKIFNYNVNKASNIKISKEDLQEEKTLSGIPDLNCFSNDFKLNLFEDNKKIKNKYLTLSPIKTKKYLYKILFNQGTMIENPFILDFHLKNSNNNKSSNNFNSKIKKKITKR